MEQVCPICNGLIDYESECEDCRGDLDETGKMEDYLGPYSPYMHKESFVYDNRNLIMGDNMCVHLYVCKQCGKLQHRSVPFYFI